MSRLADNHLILMRSVLTGGPGTDPALRTAETSGVEAIGGGWRNGEAPGSVGVGASGGKAH